MMSLPFNAKPSWFLRNDKPGFKDAIVKIGQYITLDVSTPTTKEALRDEHEECQYIFTKLHAIFQERCSDLSFLLMGSSRIKHPVVEYYYYRSCGHSKKGAGIDFALTVSVDLPGIMITERSVLGQAKSVRGVLTSIDCDQLNALLRLAGSESATYLFWGDQASPYFVTAENVRCALGSKATATTLSNSMHTFGCGLADFLCDELIGLRFGKTYIDKRDGPALAGSVGVLYQLLNQTPPPQNVIHFGVSSSDRRNVAPGMYVLARQDI